MFEQATRQKLRFTSPRGLLSVEDLWDLPLAAIDRIAVDLHRQLREAATATSFVAPEESVNAELQLKFDVAKHVIDVRVKERDEAKLANERAVKKQQLLEILARKQNAELEGMTAEELTTMINLL